MNGNFEDAAVQYERLQKASSPGSSNSAIQLAGMVPFLYALGHPDDAIALGEYVTDRTPTCGTCYANLAYAYLAKGDYDEVERVFDRARSLVLISAQAGNDNNLRAAFATALVLKGEPARALAEFESLSLPGVESTVLTWSAIAHHQLGDEQAFESAFRDLRELVGEHGYLKVAAVYARTGGLESAFESEEQLFRAFPLVPFSYASPFDLPPLDALRTDSRWSDFADRAGITEHEERLAGVSFQFSLPR